MAVVAKGRRPTDLERFLARTKRDPVTGCLVWTRATNRDGYGRFYADGFDWKAHRWIFRMMYGEEPEEVMHRCDNPPCVDWERCLRAGTRQLNNADRVAKGRTIGAHRGERHHNAKLTDSEVDQIRAEHAAGARNCDLAMQYAMDPSSISQIVNNKRRSKR